MWIHVDLNYHLIILNWDIAPTCPLCQEENEAVEHVLAKCPMSWKLRVDLFDSHFTTIADILERYEISRYVKFMIRIQARQNIGNEKD